MKTLFKTLNRGFLTSAALGVIPGMDHVGPGICSAFDDGNFDPQGNGTKGNMKIGTYVTTDTRATVETAGYFSSSFVSTTMKSNDLLVVELSEGKQVYEVAVSGTTVTPTRLTGFAGIATGFIPLDISTAREAISNDIANAVSSTGVSSGGILAQDTTPVLERANDATDKALRLNWAASNVDEIQFGSIPKPPDMDTTNDITVHLMAKMAGATDTPTIDIQVADGEGDTEMGGATAALSATLAEVTITITAANLAAAPGFLNVGLVPGAHTTDILYVYAAWIEYTRLG